MCLVILFPKHFLAHGLSNEEIGENIYKHPVIVALHIYILHTYIVSHLHKINLRLSKSTYMNNDQLTKKPLYLFGTILHHIDAHSHT